MNTAATRLSPLCVVAIVQDSSNPQAQCTLNRAPRLSLTAHLFPLNTRILCSNRLQTTNSRRVLFLFCVWRFNPKILVSKMTVQVSFFRVYRAESACCDITSSAQLSNPRWVHCQRFCDIGSSAWPRPSRRRSRPGRATASPWCPLQAAPTHPRRPRRKPSTRSLNPNF